MLARNGAELPVAFWASQAIGAVFVPLNTSWTAAEVHYALSDCDPVLVVTAAELRDRIPDEFRDRVVAIGPAGVREHEVIRTWEAVTAEAVVAADHPATIVYTSGTTGRPRGVVHTHGNHCAAVFNSSITGAAVQLLSAPSAAAAGDRAAVLHVLPWFHVAGLSAIYTSLLAGIENVVMPRWNAAEAVRIIGEERITSLGGVPTMLGQLLIEEKRNGNADLGSLRMISSGATAVPATLLRAVENEVGRQATLLTGYGLTETTASIALSVGSDLFEKPESVGCPYPVNVVQIVDDDGKQVPTGQIGQIWVSGPTVAQGYWRDPDATRAAFTKGGFCTGDLGYVDRDGYLFIAGRIKDVIIRGGENIQAAEVEQVVAELEPIMDIAVVGMPHPSLGEEVVAVIDLYPGASITDADIDAHCRQRLAKFKIPSRYIRDVPIPRNATGKSLKRVLRESLIADRA
jgi:acyl-CoA synthetase (AMP-forming)/AMP-acid ligase II